MGSLSGSGAARLVRVAKTSSRVVPSCTGVHDVGEFTFRNVGKEVTPKCFTTSVCVLFT